MSQIKIGEFSIKQLEDAFDRLMETKPYAEQDMIMSPKHYKELVNMLKEEELLKTSPLYRALVGKDQ